MKRTRWIASFAALVLGFSAIGCEAPDSGSATTSKAMEERMRDIEKRMKDALPKTQQIALAQKVDPAVVKKVQGELKTLNEYQDQPSGKIDMVTVNAIQAFQLSAGLEDDGLLNEKTLQRLEQAAKSAGPPPSAEAAPAAPSS